MYHIRLKRRNSLSQVISRQRQRKYRNLHMCYAESRNLDAESSDETTAKMKSMSCIMQDKLCHSLCLISRLRSSLSLRDGSLKRNASTPSSLEAGEEKFCSDELITKDCAERSCVKVERKKGIGICHERKTRRQKSSALFFSFHVLERAARLFRQKVQGDANYQLSPVSSFMTKYWQFTVFDTFLSNFQEANTVGSSWCSGSQDFYVIKDSITTTR